MKSKKKNQRPRADVLYTDFKKAFDIDNYDFLIKVLKSRFGGPLLTWLLSQQWPLTDEAKWR